MLHSLRADVATIPLSRAMSKEAIPWFHGLVH
jgi:hypothetical protein